jgi:hypothetical protein
MEQILDAEQRNVQPQKEPYRKLIIAVSILIPVVVAILFGVKPLCYW